MPEIKASTEEADLRIATSALARLQAAREAERFKREVAGTLVITDMDPDAKYLLTMVDGIIDEKQVGNKRPKCRIERSLTLVFHSKVGPNELRYVTVPAGATLLKETRSTIFIEQGHQSLTMDRRNNGTLVFRRSTFGAERQLAVPHYNRGVRQAIIVAR